MRKVFALLMLLFLLTTVAWGITPQRCREIQRALQENGYKVRVTGNMDASTVNALRQIQKQNHWQTKIVPDARVLQHIGLGPRYKVLLNPDTAWLPKGTKIGGESVRFAKSKKVYPKANSKGFVREARNPIKRRAVSRPRILECAGLR